MRLPAAATSELRQRHQRAGCAGVRAVPWQGQARRAAVMVKASSETPVSPTDPARRSATLHSSWSHGDNDSHLAPSPR